MLEGEAPVADLVFGWMPTASYVPGEGPREVLSGLAAPHAAAATRTAGTGTVQDLELFGGKGCLGQLDVDVDAARDGLASHALGRQGDSEAEEDEGRQAAGRWARREDRVAQPARRRCRRSAAAAARTAGGAA